MATDAELLTNVKTAINNILLSGKSISSDGSVLTHADLKNLMALRKDLEARGRRAGDATNNVHHGEFNDPSDGTSRRSFNSR